MCRNTRIPGLVHGRILSAVYSVAAIVSMTVGTSLCADELRVPAFTAYMMPDPGSARVSETQGITRWKDPAQSVNWFGRFSSSGELHAKVQLRLRQDAVSELQLSIGESATSLKIHGAGEDHPVTADFGLFLIPTEGYQRISLSSLNQTGTDPGSIDQLILSGPAAKGAHFNLKERRNAASVHLAYPLSEHRDIAAFYCEVTAVEDPVATFYMATGWHRGYFGMQVNSLTERRIIFSVWDSGNEAVDRSKVASQNRVTLIRKGADVYAGDFGNEGTGGHSHLKYMWNTGDVQKFLVTAEPVDQTFTIFSGYWFHPVQQNWMLISSWKAPKEGGWLRGLHSFSENFSGQNGHLLRKAGFANQWIRKSTGEWSEVTTATFSHDPTGKADRLDRLMGVEDGRFFLSHGGFQEGFTPFGERFTRPATGQLPDVLTLPLPAE